MTLSFLSKKEINNLESKNIIKNLQKKKIAIYGKGLASKALYKNIKNLKNDIVFVDEKDIGHLIYKGIFILNNSYKIRENKKNFYHKNLNKIIDVDFHFYEEFKNYSKYLNEKYKNYKKLFFKLQDNESKKLLKNFIKTKITNDFSYIKKYYKNNQYFIKEIKKKFNVITDIGGYDADTLLSFIKNKVHFNEYKIFEPDKKNFANLKKNILKLKKKINTYNIGLSNIEGNKIFTSKNSMSKIERGNYKLKKIKKVKCKRLDNFNFLTDYIKLDVEGHEYNVLIGSKKTIKKNKPTIACAVYHNKFQLFEIFNLLYKLNPKYKFYLRLHSLSSNELILYAK